VVDAANILTIKLIPNFEPPAEIQDHDVPVPLKSFNLDSLTHWDLCLHQILNHLNGVNHVKKIADLAQVDLYLVKMSLRQLLYYQLIRMVDIFQFSNIYRLKSLQALQTLHSESRFQMICLHYLVKDDSMAAKADDLIDFVSNLYCQMSNRISVQELVQRNQSQLKSFNISIRKCIVFGVLNGILSRVHKYPLLLSNLEGKSRSNSAGKSVSPTIYSSLYSFTSSEFDSQLLSMLDGTNCLDLLCCVFDRSRGELDVAISRIPDCVLLTR
jgi:hypothetical protein